METLINRTEIAPDFTHAVTAAAGTKRPRKSRPVHVRSARIITRAARY